MLTFWSFQRNMSHKTIHCKSHKLNKPYLYINSMLHKITSLTLKIEFWPFWFINVCLVLKPVLTFTWDVLLSNTMKQSHVLIIWNLGFCFCSGFWMINIYIAQALGLQKKLGPKAKKKKGLFAVTQQTLQKPADFIFFIHIRTK